MTLICCRRSRYYPFIVLLRNIISSSAFVSTSNFDTSCIVRRSYFSTTPSDKIHNTIMSTALSTKLSSASDDDETQVKFVHMNHAGASPSPKQVTDRVIQHISLEQKIGGYAAQDQIQQSLLKVYNDIARLIHAQSYKEIALVESATVGWTRAFYSIVQHVELQWKQNQRQQTQDHTTTAAKKQRQRQKLF